MDETGTPLITVLLCEPYTVTHAMSNVRVYAVTCY